MQTIEQRYAPLFDPERDMPTWLPLLGRVRAPGVLPGQQGPGGLLPAQQVIFIQFCHPLLFIYSFRSPLVHF